MWNKPQLMNEVSALLMMAAAACLLVSATVWGARLPLFTLREVVLTQELRELRRADLESSLSGRVRGNFFSVNLEAVRQSLEQLPWVRRAEVRRLWPSTLEVSIEEHVPAALWGPAAGQLVNTHGEVFAAVMSAPPETRLPLLNGPPAMAAEMLAHFRLAEDLFKPLGRAPHSLNVSPRLAVQVRLDDGMLIELGREQVKAPVRMRIERFVEHYPRMLSAIKQRLNGAALSSVTVDMRYPNGFALRAGQPAGAVVEHKGKP